MKTFHLDWIKFYRIFMFSFILVGCQSSEDRSIVERKPIKQPPDIASVPSAKPNKTASLHRPSQMVVAANPYAVKAGQEILRLGGSAIDAAIATQMVLNLVEPQSSGIGGGAFLMHFSATSGDIDAYDGRETAPMASTPDMFQHSDGSRMKFNEAVPGGLSVGVPGLIRMLDIAHKEHGILPWKRLFQAAIQLSKNGFIISPRLHEMIKADPHLKKFEMAKKYFFSADGMARVPGTLLNNKPLAKTLEKIADKGADAFYSGSIARNIVSVAGGSKINPGRISKEDLLGYRAKKRAPVCRPYREWFVCGMPPPTSGGVALLQILGILQNWKMSNLKPSGIEAVHLISEASKLAFADRFQYLADSDFVDVPVNKLLETKYLAARSELISRTKTMGRAGPGKIGSSGSYDRGSDIQEKGKSTSHITIIDKRGNIVSMTSTIESAFGSRLMVDGFLLNNELTDFSFAPLKGGKKVANAVWPGKRPRSSMSPSIVFNKKGGPILALGSPGGSSIIGYVAKTVIAVLDWGMDLQSAVELPHFINRNGPIELEKGTKLTILQSGLEKLGHRVKIRTMVSGLHAISISGDRITSGVDPRREGAFLAD
ncbi:MAG: gamma-glutamyltransferase [Pseudomonadota bacterium]|nr:gamma-glutamyltransferase [Pseudomonadota bacterium]